VETRCTCGEVHRSDFPPAVSEAVQYGPNVRALAVHLTQGQLLPFARASELMGDLFQLEISTGTLATWVSQASQRLQPTVAAIADDLRTACVVGADESGLRVTAKLHWLHPVVTPTHTWYGVHAKRGIEAMEAHGILMKCKGTVVHDCWKPYWQLACAHALCNAHLLRELVFIGETTAQTWPQHMMEVLLAAQDACRKARAANTELTAESIEAIVAQYRAVLAEGRAVNPEALRTKGQRGRVKQSTAFNLLDRLRNHEQEVLRFVHDLTVPFTNNLAERAIRMPKVKQKISGSFRSLDGAENFAVIRSYLDTMRKQGHRMLDSLRSVFAGQTVQPARG
jgi:transposase